MLCAHMVLVKLNLSSVLYNSEQHHIMKRATHMCEQKTSFPWMLAC